MPAERYPVSGADEVRMILARMRAPMTCSEILAKCRIYSTTTQIACALALDGRTGLVARQGVRGAFRYSLTADGNTAVARPNYVRSRARRSTHGRRHVDVSLITGENHHG